jgi:hypothetical protein
MSSTFVRSSEIFTMNDPGHSSPVSFGSTGYQEEPIAPQGNAAGLDEAFPPPSNNADTLFLNKPVHAMTELQLVFQIAVEDWDCLFAAVEERLLEAVQNPELTVAPFFAPLAAVAHATRVKTAVFDCVDALGKLHQALRQERSAYAVQRTNGATFDTVQPLPLANGHDHSPAG